MAEFTYRQLNNHRYCIIGQPRCGSHWLESIIFNNLNGPNKLKLGEFLSWWSASYSSFTVSNNLLLSNSYSTEVDNIKEMYRRRDMLKHIDPSQPLVARLFMIDNWFWDYTDIAKVFSENNFNFVYLSRDLEPQIISYYITKEKNKWSKYKFENLVFVDISILKRYIFNFVQHKLQGEKWLDTIPHEVIDYDSLLKCNVPEQITDGYFKQMPYNPYDIIINKDEVKQTFIDYYPLVIESIRSSL
jgi:hypothetical protein